MHLILITRLLLDARAGERDGWMVRRVEKVG